MWISSPVKWIKWHIDVVSYFVWHFIFVNLHNKFPFKTIQFHSSLSFTTFCHLFHHFITSTSNSKASLKCHKVRLRGIIKHHQKLLHLECKFIFFVSIISLTLEIQQKHSKKHFYWLCSLFFLSFFFRLETQWYLLLSTAKEQSGSSNGKIFKLPWHDKIKCLLQWHGVQQHVCLLSSGLTIGCFFQRFFVCDLYLIK